MCLDELSDPRDLPLVPVFYINSDGLPLSFEFVQPVPPPAPVPPRAAPTRANIRFAPRRAWLTSPTHADSSYDCICLFCSLNVVCVKIKAAKGLS